MAAQSSPECENGWAEVAVLSVNKMFCEHRDKRFAKQSVSGETASPAACLSWPELIVLCQLSKN